VQVLPPPPPLSAPPLSSPSPPPHTLLTPSLRCPYPSVLLIVSWRLSSHAITAIAIIGRWAARRMSERFSPHWTAAARDTQ
jgi:hypothetical protein